MRSVQELRMLQALPLEVKVEKTKLRIREWVDNYGEDKVYISFSGGKDSTVLLHIAREVYPNIKAVFSNTGLEYPKINEFVKLFKNLDVVKPKMTFIEVVRKYGYPIISKENSLYIHQMQMLQSEKNKKTRNLRMHGIRSDGVKVNKGKIPEKWKFLINAPFLISNQCCDVMKKNPLHTYGFATGRKYPITGQLAEESRIRTHNWIKNGCNAFSAKKPISNPMSFWTEQDILEYISKNKIKIAEPYGEIVLTNNKKEYKTTKCDRTGCVFCMFGIAQDKDRFLKLKEQESKLCDYVMRGGKFVDGMWQPSNDGLGYWFIIEWLNVHGNLKIALQDREKYLEKYQTEETRKFLEKE